MKVPTKIQRKPHRCEEYPYMVDVQRDCFGKFYTNNKGTMCEEKCHLHMRMACGLWQHLMAALKELEKINEQARAYQIHS